MVKNAGGARGAFKRLDVVGSGHVTLIEFADGLDRLGVNWRDVTGLQRELDIFRLFDRKRDGVIDFSELFPDDAAHDDDVEYQSLELPVESNVSQSDGDQQTDTTKIAQREEKAASPSKTEVRGDCSRDAKFGGKDLETKLRRLAQECRVKDQQSKRLHNLFMRLADSEETIGRHCFGKLLKAMHPGTTFAEEDLDEWWTELTGGRPRRLRGAALVNSAFSEKLENFQWRFDAVRSQTPSFTSEVNFETFLAWYGEFAPAGKYPGGH